MTHSGGHHQSSDEIFAGNRLLSTFPHPLREQLLVGATVVELDQGSVAIERGHEFHRSLFPLGATTLSVLAQIDSTRAIEAASIGREGAIGGIVSCGHSPAFARVETLVAGRALSVPMVLIEEAKAQSGHLRNLFCRYADYLLAQILQSAVCNAFHPIDARTARWLLTAHDRAGPRLQLTQASLARLLGAQRTTVNAVVRQFQDEGLIVIRRAAIAIADRDRLRARSCACYELVEDFFGEVIGESGSGAGQA